MSIVFSFIVGMLLLLIVFYVAVIYGSYGLVLLSLLGLFYLVFSFILVFVRKRGIQGSLNVPITMTEQGKSVKVFLDKKRYGKKYAGKVLFVLNIENTGLKQKKCIRQSISGEEKGSFQLKFEHGGNYEISICKICIYDWAGIFYWSIKSHERKNVLVLPNFYPVNIRLTEGVRNFVGESQVYDTLRSGDDASETFRLREFQDGDKMKNIHWKLSAKEDKLMVRENSLPKACSTVLILDHTMIKNRKHQNKRMALYLQAVASFSFSMMDMECPHYVAWQSRHYQEMKRIRVDNEESFYEFLMYLLQDFDSNADGDALENYLEKYKAEVLLHYLVLKQNLNIYDKQTFMTSLDGNHLEKALSETELIL